VGTSPSPRKPEAIRNCNDPELLRSRSCRALLHLTGSSRAGVTAVPTLREAQGVLFGQGHTGVFSTRETSQIEIAWGPAVHVDLVD